MIKGIQILGILITAIVAFIAYRNYKLGQFVRRDMFLISFICLTGFFVIIYPSTGNILLQLYSMQDKWMAIFISSNIFLFILFFYILTPVRRTQSDLGELVRWLAKSTSKYSPKENNSKHRIIQIIMPAYNEGESIAEVLEKLPKEVNNHSVVPLVVVDGSVDNTELVLKKTSHPYVAHAINRGQGDALRTGFDVALESGADIIVTMDADGQHRPEDLEQLVKPIIDGEADFVIGSRFLGKYERDSRVRQAGIVFFTHLINFLTGLKITDCTSGYRAFTSMALKRLDLSEDKFNAPEIIVDAAKKDLKIKEVPIHILLREKGETKKPRLRYAWGLGSTIIKTWIR